jgi:hypothetical protein
MDRGDTRVCTVGVTQSVVRTILEDLEEVKRCNCSNSSDYMCIYIYIPLYCGNDVAEL